MPEKIDKPEIPKTAADALAQSSLRAAAQVGPLQSATTAMQPAAARE